MEWQDYLIFAVKNTFLKYLPNDYDNFLLIFICSRLNSDRNHHLQYHIDHTEVRIRRILILWNINEQLAKRA